MFNGQSEFYKTYIDKSRTYWNVDLKDNKNIQYNIDEIEFYSEHNFEKIELKNTDINPISQFILKEYEQMITSYRCLWWKTILEQQYTAYTKFVEEYTKTGNETALCSLNNKVQTVLLHINQATAPVYEIPYYNYYYSGSYNDVLRMYYGIIADIFNISFQLPRTETTHQYKIAYCVDFEATTKVHSSMYTLKNQDQRFVVFHLPYDAFMNFDKTIKLLLHEVFHYVAPYSRKCRNFAFIKDWIVIVFEEYIDYLVSKGLSENNKKNMVQYFFEHFDDISKKVEEELGDSLDAKILNDFTTPEKIKRQKNIVELICELLCNEINHNLGLWLGEVSGCCTYKDIYPDFFDFNRWNYFVDSLRRVALAAKEAFCDLNMIYILNMSLKDYIQLLMDSLFEKYDDTVINNLLDGLTEGNKIRIGSFGLRIGLILDCYFQEDLDGDEPEKYSNKFREEINKIKNDAPEISDSFLLYLCQVYNNYLNNYRKELALFRKEIFSGERQWFIAFREKRYDLAKLQKAIESDKKISKNIAIIKDFINIELNYSLLNQNNTKPNILNHSIISISPKWQKERTVVRNLGDYVQACCNIIKAWGYETVWYRGVCKDTYFLTPSLFRNFDSNLSLYANQARYLKDAYYITMSDTNLWTDQLKTTLEHMAFLQHYGMPTSLLDFSEDMLMALHFALNPDNPKDAEQVDNFSYQPRVALFNPYKYNKAIRYMVNEGNQETDFVSPYLLDVRDELLQEYCVGDMSENYLIEHSRTYIQYYIPYAKNNKYPKPLALRRANERIQVQKGVFVAFNLFAQPEKKEKQEEYYAYLGLERIQEDYLAAVEANGESIKNKEFLKEVFIDKIGIPTIKEQLKAMNITTSYAYPEHFRLFAEYMDKLKSKK